MENEVKNSANTSENLVALRSENEKLNAAFIQAGLNPLNDNELSSFLDSCSKKGVI